MIQARSIVRPKLRPEALRPEPSSNQGHDHPSGAESSHRGCCGKRLRGSGPIDQGLRHERIGPQSLHLHPLNLRMLPAAAFHCGVHLLFYVPAEEKVRLHDDPANDSGLSGRPWPVAFAVSRATFPRAFATASASVGRAAATNPNSTRA